MSEKDFSKFQKDVCEVVPPPPPIKKICPTCITNPNYIEPDWKNTVNKPYLNEKTCEYTCVVSLDRNGNYLTTAEFRNPPRGREVALRQYIEPALRLMLREFGKLEADAIICASFPGLKLEGLATEELLELQSNYSLAYEKNLEDTPLSQRNSCIPIDEILVDATQTTLGLTAQSRATEDGDSYKTYDATKFATGQYPEITNPYALELYAVIDDFDIDPFENYLKVKVTVPAFIFDQVPEKPNIQLPGATDTVSDFRSANSVEFLSEDFSPQLIRLSTTLGIYAAYQSLFWRSEDGYLIFSDTEDVQPLSAEDTQKVDYYAITEKAKIDTFRDKTIQIIKDNDYEINRFFTGFGNLIRKVKLEFKEGEIYKLKAIKVEVDGCGYRTLTTGFDAFKEWCDDHPTTMHYAVNLKKIDMSLRASNSYPWLDFLVAYTYPQLSVIYGRLSNESVEQDIGTCVASNAIDYAVELRDTILNDSVDLMKALEYEFNNVSCSKPGDKPKPLDVYDTIDKTNQIAYQTEFDKFFAQDTLIKSLIPPETLRSLSTNPNSSVLQTLKDEPKGAKSNYAISVLSLCNVKSIGMSAIRCLLSGTSYDNAMSKIVRVALESMNIDVLGFFIENLPPEAQVKIRQQYERDFSNLPLPWESGYDPGSMSNSNPYQKYKDGFIEQALVGASVNEKIQEKQAQYTEFLETFQRLGAEQDVILDKETGLENEQGIAQREGDDDKVAALEEQINELNVQFNSLEAQRDEARQMTAKLEKEIKDLQFDAGEKDPNVSSSPLTIWRELPAEEKKMLADAANREAAAPENTPPGTYGNALGSLQKTITSAYIDYMMDSLQIDVLLQTLDRVPLVSELLPRLISSVKCASQSPADPSFDNFLSTLTLDVCGDLRNGIAMPEIPKIPNFFDKSLLTTLSNIFIKKFSQTMAKVMFGMLFKLLETVDSALCDSINALGAFTAGALTGGNLGLDEAFKDAFCPDGDDDDLAATKDGIFGGIGGFGGDIDCLYRTINSVSSRKENVQLLAGEGSPNASARIAAAVNTFCPDYSGVMGRAEDVEQFYKQAGSFCPPELMAELLDQVNTIPDGPIYESICLTQDELEQWNRDRERLLTDNGLDEETARDMIDKANDRVLDDLGDVAKIMQQGPQGLMEQAIDDLLSRADPTCSVNKSAITLETPESRQQKKGLINDFFRPLEKHFFDDLIGEFHSVLVSILRDMSDNSLKLHEFFTKIPIFLPNYTNSQADWDNRKENGSVIYTWMMEEDRAGGFFPETVGLHLKNQMMTITPPDSSGVIRGQFTNGAGDITRDFTFSLEVARKGSLGDEFKIKARQTSHIISPFTDDTLYSSTETDRVTYNKHFAYDESFLEGAVGQSQPYVQVFENLLKRGLDRPVEIGSVEASNVYRKLNMDFFNITRDAVLNNPEGGLPVGFKFGYDSSQRITFNDLLYVNPNATGNEDTWEYTYEEEDRILGKSATENPRVHFLDPGIHGGSFKRPKIYIEPATYDGWLGMVRTFVPEIGTCEDDSTNFLDLTQITNRVKQVEDNLPFDKRLELAPECRVELPFDRQFSPVNHGLMEGVILSTCRVYTTEFILKTLPVFGSVEMSPRNIDGIFTDVLMKEMQDGMVDEYSIFSTISGYTYWLLFLEQSYQVVERMVLDGMIEMTPELTAAKEEIDKAKADFNPLGQDFEAACLDIARGSGIIAYGEEWQEVVEGDVTKLSFSSVASVLVGAGTGGIFSFLSPFRLGLANKIYTIWKARDAAKVFLREIVKTELALLSDKLNFNMRPRPHVYDINKYLLSRNGFVRGSTLRAGESRIEAPVTGGKSGLAYGSILDVPRNISEENALDGLLLAPGELEELNEKGVFYLERYIRTTDKDFVEQVYNIREFQELLSDRAVYEEGSKLSDHFGNLELISDDTVLVGSLGVQFGVRLMYCPPTAFSYDLTDLDAETNRAFFHKPAMIQIAGETSQRPWPLTARTVPIAVFEQDVLDKKIKDINFEDENMGEDLKCYIDNLAQTEEYQVLVDYCFPVKSYVSTFGIYSYYGFFESIGKDPSENEESQLSIGDPLGLWKAFLFNESKSTCRKLFNSVYRSDDDSNDFNFNVGRLSLKKFVEGIVPQLYLNLDASISWWQQLRIVSEKPFDADGKDCKNGFQKLFDK